MLEHECPHGLTLSGNKTAAIPVQRQREVRQFAMDLMPDSRVLILATWRGPVSIFSTSGSA